MTDPVKVLAVNDEADFEALLRQHFRRCIRGRADRMWVRARPKTHSPNKSFTSAA
jgi:hypothetical protein